MHLFTRLSWVHILMIRTVSLLKVERTDIFVLVIGGSYGEITEREYDDQTIGSQSQKTVPLCFHFG